MNQIFSPIQFYKGEVMHINPNVGKITNQSDSDTHSVWNMISTEYLRQKIHSSQPDAGFVLVSTQTWPSVWMTHDRIDVNWCRICTNFHADLTQRVNDLRQNRCKSESSLLRSQCLINRTKAKLCQNQISNSILDAFFANNYLRQWRLKSKLPSPIFPLIYFRSLLSSVIKACDTLDDSA